MAKRARPGLLWMALALCGASVAGCKKKPSAPAAVVSVKSYPDSIEGLKQYFTDMLTASRADPALADKMAEQLSLPEDWFAKHYDPETSMRLTTEYRAEVHTEALPKLVQKLANEGKPEVLVERFASADDKQMNGFESYALRNAKTQYVAYSVRFTAPGKRSGYHLYTFVYADGAFRLAGKMKAVREKPLGEQNAALFELRRADVESFMTTGSFPDE